MGQLSWIARTRYRIWLGTHENETGNNVSLTSFYEFVLGHFDIELSYATISNYLYEDGFASNGVQKKAKSFVVDLDAL